MKKLKKNKKTLIIGGILTAALLAGAAVLISRPGAVAVSRVKAEKKLLQDWYTENAVLHLGQDVTRISEVSGPVLRIHAKEGSQVKKGDLILEIDSKDYQTQRTLTEAALKGYRAQLDLQKVSQIMTASPQEYVSSLEQQLSGAEAAWQAAKTVYEADQKLYAIGSISTAQYQQDTAAYEAALAAYEQARKRYDESSGRLASMEDGGALADRQFYDGGTAQIEAQIEAQEALLAQLDDRIAKCTVRAESDGVVKSIFVKDVSAVAEGSPLFTFSEREAGSAIAEADILTSAAPYIKEGTPVRVRIRTRGDDQVLEGSVTEVHGYADKSTSALGLEEYRVHIKAAVNAAASGADGGQADMAGQTDASGLTALPDGFGADLEILLFDRDDCVVIPSGAIYKEQGRSYVLKEEGGRAVSVPVEVLYSSGTDAAIAAGLSDGEEILNNIDQEGLHPGVKVK